MRLLLLAAAALAALVPHPRAEAQTAGQVLERSVPAFPDPGRAPLPDQTAPPEPDTPVTGDATIQLSAVAIEGNTVYDDATLQALVADRVGTEQGASGLAAIARTVQAFYRGEGYIFTRVVVSDVDTAAGSVTLTVVEAVIDDVSVEEPAGDIGPVRKLVEKYAATLVGLKNPRLKDLERVGLLINDVPGIARATVVPRAAETGDPGAVALAINVEHKLVSGIAFLDTRQQPAFGQGLAGAVVQFGGYGSGGDTSAVTVTNTFWDSTDDFKERNIVQLEQRRFFGSSGANATLRGLWGRSRPGAELDPLELEGTDWEISLVGEYPVIRSRAASYWQRLGFDVISRELDIAGGEAELSDDDLRVIYLEGEALLRDPYGFTEIILGYRQGLGGFLGGSEEGDAGLSRFDGNPSAGVLYASLERDQVLTDKLTLITEVSGQFATDPLLAPEEFALGGTTLPKGFDPSEELGDHGLGLAVELNYFQPFRRFQRTFSVQPYSFGEVGRIWNIGSPPGASVEQTLASVGGGVRLGFEDSSLLELEIAYPFQELRRQGAGDVRFFLSAQHRF